MGWHDCEFMGCVFRCWVVARDLWPREPREGFVFAQVSDDGPVRELRLV